MTTSIKVKFTEAISSGIGSFSPNQVAELPTHIAKPWLKTGQVVFADAAEKARVEKAEADAAKPAPKTPPAPKPAPKATPAPEATEDLG